MPVSPAIIPKNIKTSIDPPRAPNSGRFNNTLSFETFRSLSSFDFS